MANTVWTVNEFQDSYRERPAKVRTEMWFGSSTHPRFKHIFESEEEARRFLIKRSADAIEKAELDLKAARARHSKCVRKFFKFDDPSPAVIGSDPTTDRVTARKD